MKKFFVVSLLALAPASVGVQEDSSFEIAGSMDCKVQSNSVVSISEGKSQSYTGFQDKFDVGDNLRFEYSLVVQLNLYLALEDQNRDEVLVKLLILDEELLTHFSAGTEGGFWQLPFRDSASFSFDYIRLNADGYDLRLNRYYKNDWQGMGMGFQGAATDELTAHVFTLDCRHGTDRVDDIVNWLLDAASK